jgi:hypothetical protein
LQGTWPLPLPSLQTRYIQRSVLVADFFQVIVYAKARRGSENASFLVIPEKNKPMKKT